MQNPERDSRADTIQLLLPWGMPSSERREDMVGAALLWAAGSACLLLWTGLALLLTSA